jgi:hypothetical protein
MAKSSCSTCKKKNDRKFYLNNWIQKKIQCIISKQKAVDNRFYLFNKVLSEDGVDRCLDDKPRCLNILEKGRKFGPQDNGNKKFQETIRNEKVQFGLKAKGPGRQEMVFPKFLLAVASTLGLIGAQLATHHKLIKHEIGLQVFPLTHSFLPLSHLNIIPIYFAQTIQGFHLDASPEDVLLEDGTTTVHGVGNGFSAFLGMSKRNSLWIGSFTNENRIVEEQLVQFGKGDLLVLPFGTLHAGDKNRTTTPSYKLFSEVFTETMTDSKSQLWALQGKGFTSKKQCFQLDPNERCIFV